MTVPSLRRVAATGALALLALTGPLVTASQAREVPRVVLVLYEGQDFEDASLTPVHRVLETPLNHLGLVVRYHDIRRPLPPASQLQDVRAVLTFFQTAGVMRDPAAYADWAARAVASGRRLVVFGDSGVSEDVNGRTMPPGLAKRFFALIGVDYDGSWTANPYNVRAVAADARLVGFERPLPAALPPYARVAAARGRGVAHLTLRKGSNPAEDSDAIVTSPTGGYVAPGFVYYSAMAGGYPRRQWYVDPFEFLRQALGTDDLPKPDPTTVSGRRLYYSHIDGDGWLNVSEVEPYRKRRVLSARVVLRELIDPYPDLPVTVGPVVADLDPEWQGTAESVAIAREIFARPQVEAGSHTYSHPLEWRFFEHYDQTRERQYGQKEVELRATSDAALGRRRRYMAARNYSDKPFDLDQEIAGSVRFVQGLLPPGKQVQVLQWSGDTMPFAGAFAAARRAGVRTINGGDTRFDAEFPSYAWVAPIGRAIGRDWQIYSSNSNENTYTDLWTRRFFGFTFLVRTLRNTALPLRVKPFNVYYHMYSGEKLASLSAVRRNLEYARSQELAPVAASEYSAIAEGFYACRIDQVGPRWWRVRDRGALQTVRLDHASLLAVDLARSRGVIGQRHQHGSLYIALDAAHPAPEIVVLDLAAGELEPRVSRPSLVQARWRVWDLRVDPDGFRFRAQGFGAGEMTWQLPAPGRVRVSAPGTPGVQPIDAATDAAGVLRVTVPARAAGPIEVRVQRVEKRS